MQQGEEKNVSSNLNADPIKKRSQTQDQSKLKILEKATLMAAENALPN